MAHWPIQEYIRLAIGVSDWLEHIEKCLGGEEDYPGEHRSDKKREQIGQYRERHKIADDQHAGFVAHGEGKSVNIKNRASIPTKIFRFFQGAFAAACSSSPN